MAQGARIQKTQISTEDGIVTGQKIESSETALMTSDRQARRTAEIAYLVQVAQLTAGLEISERNSPYGTAIEIR